MRRVCPRDWHYCSGECMKEDNDHDQNIIVFHVDEENNNPSSTIANNPSTSSITSSPTSSPSLSRSAPPPPPPPPPMMTLDGLNRGLMDLGMLSASCAAQSNRQQRIKNQKQTDKLKQATLLVEQRRQRMAAAQLQSTGHHHPNNNINNNNNNNNINSIRVRRPPATFSSFSRKFDNDIAQDLYEYVEEEDDEDILAEEMYIRKPGDHQPATYTLNQLIPPSSLHNRRHPHHLHPYTPSTKTPSSTTTATATATTATGKRPRRPFINHQPSVHTIPSSGVGVGGGNQHVEFESYDPEDPIWWQDMRFRNDDLVDEDYEQAIALSLLEQGGGTYDDDGDDVYEYDDYDFENVEEGYRHDDVDDDDVDEDNGDEDEYDDGSYSSSSASSSRSISPPPCPFRLYPSSSSASSSADPAAAPLPSLSPSLSPTLPSPSLPSIVEVAVVSEYVECPVGCGRKFLVAGVDEATILKHVDECLNVSFLTSS